MWSLIDNLSKRQVDLFILKSMRNRRNEHIVYREYINIKYFSFNIRHDLSSNNSDRL